MRLCMPEMHRCGGEGGRKKLRAGWGGVYWGRAVLSLQLQARNAFSPSGERVNDLIDTNGLRRTCCRPLRATSTHIGLSTDCAASRMPYRTCEHHGIPWRRRFGVRSRRKRHRSPLRVEVARHVDSLAVGRAAKGSATAKSHGRRQHVRRYVWRRNNRRVITSYSIHYTKLYDGFGILRLLG